MRALAIVAALSATAHAELEEKGVRAGPVVFSMTRDGGQSQGEESIISRPGWMAGAWLTWRMADNFALQLETALSDKHLRSELCTSSGINSTGCMTTASISIYYLEIPFLLRLDLMPAATKVHLDFGVEGAVTLGGGRTPVGGDFQRFEDLVPINLGGVAGFGLELPVGPGKIALDLRYKRWVVPITGGLDPGDPPTAFGSPGRDIKPSHQAMLTAGYAFP